VLFWGAGAAFATRFSGWVETATSVALVGFGLWVAIGAWREMHKQSHDTKTGSHIALLLILGSSPMIEGIPAFFAAGQYGLWLLIIMALVFAAATISVYIVFSVYSAKGLKQVRFGRFERYGEIVSGAVIALVGAVFWFWPVA
jgi:ABC-type nickel/cobalt efflux system permease component RcnA